jgi:hypothetical protein
MAPDILASDLVSDEWKKMWNGPEEGRPSEDCAVKFDPARHMAFEPPSEVITLKELLLSEDNACSPVAITKPFPLFSLEGVTAMRRDVFRKEVVQRHGQKIAPGVYKMRGYSQDAAFVDAVWRSPEVVAACSRAAGVDLELMFDYEIGHVNVQVDELADKPNLWDVLPPAVPKARPDDDPDLLPVAVVDSDSVNRLRSVRDWHVDAYPWVCVCMLSDPAGMVGGETAIEKGDGSVVKMLGPGVGYAVMMQGGCVNHAALRAYGGGGERVTMVTSFRARDPLLKDMSTLHITNQSSRLEELFVQWATYRMDVLSQRAAAIKDEIEAAGRRGRPLSADAIRRKMDDWVREQTSYLETTCREMHDAVPYGTATEVH